MYISAQPGSSIYLVQLQNGMHSGGKSWLKRTENFDLLTLVGNPVKTWRILLVQSFTARNDLAGRDQKCAKNYNK